MDKFELPAEWVGSEISVALKGLIMMRGPGGEQVPAFLNIRGTMNGQSASSVFIRVNTECILGPIGDHAIPKETIQGACKIGSINVVNKISLT
jgi:hypothetical protein